MGSPDLTSSYDDVADVLYLSAPCMGSGPTRNHDEGDGLVLKRELETGAPMGAILLDFKAYWGHRRDQAVARLAEFFEVGPSAVIGALPRR